MALRLCFHGHQSFLLTSPWAPQSHMVGSEPIIGWLNVFWLASSDHWLCKWMGPWGRSAGRVSWEWAGCGGLRHLLCHKWSMSPAGKDFDETLDEFDDLFPVVAADYIPCALFFRNGWWVPWDEIIWLKKKKMERLIQMFLQQASQG